jgi:hypothetical protein
MGKQYQTTDLQASMPGRTMPEQVSVALARSPSRPPRRGVPEVGRLSCCTFVFVDEATKDVSAAELLGCG